MKVVVIKYNAGNIQSVMNALERLGVSAILTDEPEEILRADRVVFPGVGEASSAMQYLREKQMDRLILSLRQPVLGICLGMQLLGVHSEENDTPCLGLIPARVLKIPSSVSDGSVIKVPHVGWNTIDYQDHPLFQDLEADPYFYFVHSYAMELNACSLARTVHGISFCSAVQWRNFTGVQFHPEKSAEAGAKLLRNFIGNNGFPIFR